MSQHDTTENNKTNTYRQSPQNSAYASPPTATATPQLLTFKHHITFSIFFHL
jgi:hypothetical protein